MSQEPITIVEYDPEWVAEYERCEREIRRVVGDRIEAVEHVGSTAVPGLAAKPIVDLMVGVASLDDADACVQPLVAAGWEYAPEFEAQVPERRYFRRFRGGDHTHHLHVVETGSDWWERHLHFRDYLREHPDLAREYDRLKRDLAERFRWDVDGYTDGKDDFIRDVEERAREFFGK